MNADLILPNRDCGACQVCCVLPDINEPELVKPAGAACKHLCGSGCSIQETKPAACRAFQCAWRLLPEIPEGWRPDRVGMLGIIGVTAGGKRAVQFIPFRRANPAIVRGLRRLSSTFEVWLGLPEGKLRIDQLPNRDAWRKLRRAI